LDRFGRGCCDSGCDYWNEDTREIFVTRYTASKLPLENTLMNKLPADGFHLLIREVLAVKVLHEVANLEFQ
jgi:hypothetical protein